MNNEKTISRTELEAEVFILNTTLQKSNIDFESFRKGSGFYLNIADDLGPDWLPPHKTRTDEYV